MTRGTRETVISMIVLVALSVGLVWGTQNARSYVQRPYLHDDLYLPSGKFVELASLGYHELVADIVWFNAVQYYGGYKKSQHDLAYFEGLINIVTDLDPHFIFPYRFGSIVMSQEMDSFENGIQLLKKGMVANPGDWRFPFEIGFLSYVDARDNATAGRYFELASRMPGGGDKARRFAAFVYSRAGHGQNSIRMWEELLEITEEPWMRELAKGYIEKARAKQAGGNNRVDS